MIVRSNLVMTKVYGYVTSRPFGDFIMPVPAQNSCLREYCKNIGAQFIIPQLEHKFENCYMQLWTTVSSMNEGDILAMYSAEIINTSTKALEIIKTITKKGITTHFVLENISIKHIEDVNKFILTNKIKSLTLKKSILIERIKTE